MKKILLLGASLFFFVPCILSEPIADWTILTIMQADNNLAPFATQNINDVQKNIVGYKVNKLFYWHKPRSTQRVKYRIRPNGAYDEEFVDIKGTPNMQQELIDAMQWAASKYPAKNYMLNLWNHGTGTIDQSAWGNKYRFPIRSFNNECSWLEVPGLEDVYDRGILYSDSTRTFLTNQQLTNVCKYIKENILKKKLDILGMDACLMAMLEVSYQVKDYATYMVSSENLEPGRGWNYGSFIKTASTAPDTLSPLKLAQSIVDSYAQYYNGKYSFYTLSTIDLNEINDLKSNLDNIINKIFECNTAQVQNIFSAVKQAALNAVRFDSSDFIDMHSFYTNLVKNIKTRGPNQKNGFIQKTNNSQEILLTQLQESLEQGMTQVLKAVKHNKTGSSFSNAKGISIYFPRGGFHPSYSKTLFANDSAWTYLVQAANIAK